MSALLKMDCHTDGQESASVAPVFQLAPFTQYEISFQVAGGGTTTTVHQLTLPELLQTNALRVHEASDFGMDQSSPGLAVVGSGASAVVTMAPRRRGGPLTQPDGTFENVTATQGWECGRRPPSRMEQTLGT